jgi:nicotinamide riboside transporter PnuC
MTSKQLFLVATALAVGWYVWKHRQAAAAAAKAAAEKVAE